MLCAGHETAAMIGRRRDRHAADPAARPADDLPPGPPIRSVRLGRSRGSARGPGSRLARTYRTVLVRGAYPVIAFWVLAAVLVPVLLGGAHASSGSLGGLLPPNSQAVKLEIQAVESFTVPILSETTVVLYNDAGLSPLTRADALLYALSIDRRSSELGADPGKNHIIGAVPVPTLRRDILATYLYISNGTSYADVQRLAEQYAAHFHNVPGNQTYVTGVTPAQLAQGRYLAARLDLFAIVSVLLIAVIVGITFRSATVPVLVLAVAGLAYIVSWPILNVAANRFGFPLPSQVQPLVIALLLGVVTDYCVLFVNRFRIELSRSGERHAAGRATMRYESAVVAVAGITETGGLLALLAANLQLFRSFGPSLALTVLLGLIVSLTLTPALMVVLGHRLFHPLAGRRRMATITAADEDRPSRAMAAILRVVTVRPRAGCLLAAVVIALLAAAAPVAGIRFDLSFTSGLPSSDPVQRGAAVLDRAGIRGITAPLEILVDGTDVGARETQLASLQGLILEQPGVAEVLGPAQNPLPRNFGVVVSKDGNHARLLAIFDTDPLTADAVATYQRLRDRLPTLAAEAGLGDVRVQATGQTAIAAELAALTRHNLEVTLFVAVAVQLAILLLYLRAVVAPIVLLLGSVLGVAATLGLTVVMFQHIRHDPGLTFYVPFATAVLLLSLGADYNVFSVGTIWDEARRRPLRGALTIALPRASRAVTSAGLILAATFAATAIIPLENFRQIAFTMGVGLLIDTLVIRPLFTPAVLTVLGSAAGWPSRRIRTQGPEDTAGREPGTVVPVTAGGR